MKKKSYLLISDVWTPDIVISNRVNRAIKYCHLKSSSIVKTTNKASVFLSKRWYKRPWSLPHSVSHCWTGQKFLRISHSLQYFTVIVVSGRNYLLVKKFTIITEHKFYYSTLTEGGLLHLLLTSFRAIFATTNLSLSRNYCDFPSIHLPNLPVL